MNGISVVTATYLRPTEVRELLDNLTRQTVPPREVILIDGAPPEVTDTERTVMAFPQPASFEVRYIRKSGGTAIQRNAGIDVARGDYVAFIDDDVRLEPDYFERMLTIFKEDTATQIGGIAGYITNQYIDAAKSLRWRWFRRLRLFSTFEPGRYDYQTGYTINRYLQPPHDGLREIDWMGSNCGVWRSEVFAGGLRFSEFFKDYGMLEDAHLALRAGRNWRLLENGAAHCVHLHSPGGRVNMRRWARKTAVNFRFVFVDIVPRRSMKQELRFWGIQVFDLFRLTLYAFRMHELRYFALPLGKAEGIIEAAGLGLRRQ